MNKNKLVLLFLSLFVIGGGCYSLFYSRNKEFFKEEKEPDVLEIAKKDILLLCQQLDDYEQKVSDEKKVRQEDLEKSIEILKDQGIWNGLLTELKDDDDDEAPQEKSIDRKNLEENVKILKDQGVLAESRVNFERYHRAIQDSKKAFQLQLDELLEKIEKEKNLESFHEELEKFSKEYKKRIGAFTEFAQKIQEEAKKPMPFCATWIGLVSCIIISVVAYYAIFYKIFMYFECFERDSDEGSFFILFIMLCLSYVFYFLINKIFCFINYLLASKKDYKDDTYFYEEASKFILNNASKSNFAIWIYMFVPVVSGGMTMFYYMKRKYEKKKNGEKFSLKTIIKFTRKQKRD